MTFYHIRVLFASLCIVRICIVHMGMVTLAQDWPHFRGPYSNGHADAKNLPLEMGEDKNLQWKVEVPGRGWSSPVVVDDQIWLTTAIETEYTEAERKERLKSTRMGGMAAYKRVQLMALCFERDTGEVRHSIELFDVSEPPLINELNSFASPTPAIDGEHVICNFGSFGTVCLDRKTGNKIWENTDYNIDHQTGPGSSPFIHGEKLILTFDGTDQQFVAAINKNTGKAIWKTDRSGELHEQLDFKKAYTTPLIVEVNGKEQLISVGADWVYGYDADSGKELWKVKFGALGFSNAPQPLFDDGMLFVCTGYPRSKLLAIDLKLDQPAIAWSYTQHCPAMPTPLLVDNRIYVISDKGIASCVDKKTGEAKWQERLGGNFSSSPILADGHIFVGNRADTLFVFKPGDTFELVASNSLDGRMMATPAIFKQSIIVRTEQSLYHFSKAD